MNRKTGVSVTDNLGIRRKVNMEVGPNMGYLSGDVLDANATAKLIEDKINAVIGGASSALDTLKEIGDAIPTKLSDLTNDVGYITESNGQLQVNTTNISVISNQPFPSTWPTSNQDTISDLIAAIDGDDDAVKGKVYLSTVHYSDLPDNLADAELKVEIMNSTGSHKIAVFTLTSANQAPYNWHTTMWVGDIEAWHSYALYEPSEELGL